jgi:serine/threonine-protein kinase SRPK3
MVIDAFFHSTHPGQVLNDRYQTITKLGWGFGSTVWLAEDLRHSTTGGPCQPSSSVGIDANESKEEPESPRYVAIKIGTCTYGSIAAAGHELKGSQHIAGANPSHPGAGYIRTPIDNFEIHEPHGVHACLVYTPMREMLYDFRNRFINQRLSPPILKLYVVLLLQGLNYLHSECHMVHTGKFRVY